MTAHQDALAADLGVMPLPAAAVEASVRDHLVVVAYGEPVGQGSKVKLSHGAMVDSNAKRLRPWRATVSAAAREALEEMYPDGQVLPLFGRGVPVHVSLVFTFARPASHYGTGRNAAVLKPSAPAEHIGFPDVDKAQRAALDAFTDAGVVADDRQFTRILLATRVYPGGHPDALTVPGMVARFRAVSR